MKKFISTLILTALILPSISLGYSPASGSANFSTATTTHATSTHRELLVGTTTPGTIAGINLVLGAIYKAIFQASLYIAPTLSAGTNWTYSMAFGATSTQATSTDFVFGGCEKAGFYSLFQNGTSTPYYNCNPLNNGVVSEYGQANLAADFSTSATSFVDIGVSWTLPSAGIWKVSYYSTVQNSSNITYLQITDSAGIAVPNTLMGAAQGAGIRAGISASSLITTTAPTTYKLQGKVNGGTGLFFGTGGSQANTIVTWEKIGGTTAVTGQTVDYISGRLGSSQSTNIAVNDHIKFDTVLTGNIPLDTSTTYTNTSGVASIGRISLKANKTYELTGVIGEISFGSPNNNNVRFQWYDVTTGTAVQLGNSTAFATEDLSASYAQRNVTASAIFTPTVDSKVELRLASANNVSIIAGGSSYPTFFTIKQLGTSAITSNTKVQIQGGVSGTNIANGSNFQLTLTPTLQQGASLSGNNFIAPRDGTYLFTYGVSGNWTWTVNGFWLPNMTVGGSTFNGNICAVPNGASYYTGCTYSRALRMTAGQSASLNIIQASGQTGNVGGNSDTFSITEL